MLALSGFREAWALPTPFAWSGRREQPGDEVTIDGRQEVHGDHDG
jgi:hypothetical protein